MCGASRGPSVFAFLYRLPGIKQLKALHNRTRIRCLVHISEVWKPNRALRTVGRRAVRRGYLSKKIRVHAFGDCCPVVVFTIIAIPENIF